MHPATHSPTPEYLVFLVLHSTVNDDIMMVNYYSGGVTDPLAPRIEFSMTFPGYASRRCRRVGRASDMQTQYTKALKPVR